MYEISNGRFLKESLIGKQRRNKKTKEIETDDLVTSSKWIRSFYLMDQIQKPTMKRVNLWLDVFPAVFLVGYAMFITAIVAFIIISDNSGKDVRSEKYRRTADFSSSDSKENRCEWGKSYLGDDAYSRHLKWRLKLVEDRCDLCQVSRHQTNIMEDLCSFTRNVTSQTFENILVDDKRNIMYCVVPKTACSNWKRALVRLRNGSISPDFNIHRRIDMRSIGFRYLSEYPMEKREGMIQTYFKFMFVRNPFDRLLSAYRDKFTRNITWSLYFQRKYGQSIINMFRPNDTEAWASGAGVKFDEFIKYIIKARQKGRVLNAHWKPYAELCQPCRMKYDFIGKFETLEKDAFWVLRKMSHKKCPFQFPRRNLNPKLTVANILQYYRGLSGSVLSQLYEMFQTDFDFFGYEVQRVPRTGQIIV